MSAERFRFVQLDVPGRLGLDDGRYLIRMDDADRDEESVLVVETLGAPAAPRRLRRRRPRRVDSAEPPMEVPVTRLTVVPAQRLTDSEAERELDALRADPAAAEDAIVGGLRAMNRVLRAHRIATQDPYGHEIGRLAPLAARTGFGSGAELADGGWTEAVDVPPPERRQRRVDALRPQERLAELVARREPIDACETLLLRARADVDQGHPREAALQLSGGLEALLIELRGRAGRGQEEDLAALRERRDAIRKVALEALHGDPAAGRQQVSETLAICERVLRRRQALRD